MSRYMEIAGDLRKEAEVFLDTYCGEDEVAEAAVKLGYMINLAVRCAPRAVQSTVRKNIVQEAVGRYCKVTMTEETDERTGRTYNKIRIEPRS